MRSVLSTPICLHTAFFFYRCACRVIDWEDTAPGYYLFEIAVLFSELEAPFANNSASSRKAFYAEYLENASPPDAEAMLETFFAIRCIHIAGWFARDKSPAGKRVTRQWLARGFTRMRRAMDASSA